MLAFDAIVRVASFAQFVRPDKGGTLTPGGEIQLGQVPPGAGADSTNRKPLRFELFRLVLL